MNHQREKKRLQALLAKSHHEIEELKMSSQATLETLQRTVARLDDEKREQAKEKQKLKDIIKHLAFQL